MPSPRPRPTVRTSSPPPGPPPRRPRVTVRTSGAAASPRRSAVAASMLPPPLHTTVPDEVVEAKEKLVTDLGGFDAHLAAQASAALRTDRRLGMENIVCVYVGEKKSGGRPTGQWAV